MIRRQFKEQYCHFRSCCSQDYEAIAAEKSAHPRTAKPNKISLKTNAKPTKRLLSPSPTFQHRHAISRNCPTAAESTRTLKPNVKFSWKNEMTETTKKVGLATDQPGLKQLQLRETRTPKLLDKLLIESKFASELVSGIGMSELQQEAKLEESLIVVDYFNPSSQQMSRIESYLDGKR